MTQNENMTAQNANTEEPQKAQLETPLCIPVLEYMQKKVNPSHALQIALISSKAWKKVFINLRKSDKLPTPLNDAEIIDYHKDVAVMDNNRYFAFMDASNTVMFFSDNMQTSREMMRHYDLNITRRLPQLSYIASDGENIKCRYSQELLQPLLAILSTVSDSVMIETRHDYPITLTAKCADGSAFGFILAPRVIHD